MTNQTRANEGRGLVETAFDMPRLTLTALREAAAKRKLAAGGAS